MNIPISREKFYSEAPKIRFAKTMREKGLYKYSERWYNFTCAG